MIRLRTTAGLAERYDYGGRKLWLVAATAQVKLPSSEVVKPTREGGSPLGLPMGRMSIMYVFDCGFAIGWAKPSCQPFEDEMPTPPFQCRVRSLLSTCPG